MWTQSVNDVRTRGTNNNSCGSLLLFFKLHLFEIYKANNHKTGLETVGRWMDDLSSWHLSCREDKQIPSNLHCTCILIFLFFLMILWCYLVYLIMRVFVTNSCFYTFWTCALLCKLHVHLFNLNSYIRFIDIQLSQHFIFSKHTLTIARYTSA